jgi:hypothetical protein
MASSSYAANSFDAFRCRSLLDDSTGLDVRTARVGIPGTRGRVDVDAWTRSVAAHITAASRGGRRFDAALTPQQRSAIENGIWLCQNCATLIDRDEATYPIEVRRVWKLGAERRAADDLARTPASPSSKPIGFAYVRDRILDDPPDAFLKRTDSTGLTRFTPPRRPSWTRPAVTPYPARASDAAGPKPVWPVLAVEACRHHPSGPDGPSAARRAHRPPRTRSRACRVRRRPWKVEGLSVPY